MLQVSDEGLLTSSSLVSPISERDECGHSVTSGKDELSLGVAVHTQHVTSPRTKKLPTSNKATKHNTAQV